MDFAELQCISNFSFLQGASHPTELITRAAQLGYRALALTDLHSLSGIVRAHICAKELDFQFLVGSRLVIQQDSNYPHELLVYPRSKAGYHSLSSLLTLGKCRAERDGCILTLQDLIAHAQELVVVAVPADFSSASLKELAQLELQFENLCAYLKECFTPENMFSIAISRNYSHGDKRYLESVAGISRLLQIPLLASNRVFYHSAERKALQDVLSCIREHTSIQKAGYLLQANAERYLKSVSEMHRLFADLPAGVGTGALRRTLELSEALSNFSLDQLRYEYPHEICPNGVSAFEYLKTLTWKGAAKRFPDGIPEKITLLLEQEFKLIHELGYEKYFLTCYDIVRHARSLGILCQGRGAAANSAVCFCLEITSVNPDEIDLLFARFVSKERNEPPDIDIDFEHERREEVIQYIYKKYGRDRAALTCEVVSYRQRSAVRDVGKALGLPLALVDKLAKSIHRWTGSRISKQDLAELGLSAESSLIHNCLTLSAQLKGFPRHLSQHVGGFIISEQPLSEIVPIRNASMPERTIIEWDKNDIEALGILKIDILALGMLSCIRKAFDYIVQNHANHADIALHKLPADDSATFDMICRADTIGVFQIESRAQMSMLPRLKPRCYYDLVIEVAIVRPGPIHGNMVHPFLKRRNGLEAVHYPDEEVKQILGKTLGVPIFQEQAMRLAIVLAGFSPGEAEKLRRAMAAWKTNETIIDAFRARIFEGMRKKGYSQEFAETCMDQMKGFSEYGFPESHAASFAHLVYASAWIKCHYPAEFAAALLNSQPMGFYAASQIIQDATRHGVSVLEIDVNHSHWDSVASAEGRYGSLRLGFRQIKGLSQGQADLIVNAVKCSGTFSSIRELWRATLSLQDRLRLRTLYLLARADAFSSMGLTRREALWQIRSLPETPLPIDQLLIEKQQALPFLKPLSKQQNMFADYSSLGFSLDAHPIEFLRNDLLTRSVQSSKILSKRTSIRENEQVSVAGLAIFRQRPGTARGVLFVTLEDETGMINLIVRNEIFEKYQKILLSAACLLASGRLQRVGQVIYVLVEHLESLDSHPAFRDVAHVVPSRSWSY